MSSNTHALHDPTEFTLAQFLRICAGNLLHVGLSIEDGAKYCSPRCRRTLVPFSQPTRAGWRRTQP